MITQKQKIELKEIIGSKHIQKLQNYFMQRGIKNRYQESYSLEYISLIFNGKVTNKKVEDAIFDYVPYIMQKRATVNEERADLLANAKKQASHAS
ncbi:hypothetical protein [Zunongwangia sp. HGR-M22]|uniref:hypothetical protein n=1 Tax=Zunongwangia sp. HGR-M22 TaxID=3015168 RepID=UPI0022DCE960|nr:hypothetical protein [Zunongwangia sp. HGR-M22]WBL25088.1 hypothetical protein PBT91_14440 [Zunongwangia sp. HGR-M22]